MTTHDDDEREIVRLLSAAPPRPVPADLEARIQAAVRAQRSAESGTAAVSTPARRGRRTPPWALAAAAGLVLAVATPLLMERMGAGGGGEVAIDEAEVTAMLTETLPSPWFGDGGTVAGAPVLDDLSDDALLQLLEEMEE